MAKQVAYVLVASVLTLLILLVVGFSVWGRMKLENTSEALQIQNLRFDAALNNMSHGLVMFDAHTRLVVCNERYMQIYGLSPDVAKPGTSRTTIAVLPIAFAKLCARVKGHGLPTGLYRHEARAGLSTPRAEKCHDQNDHGIF